ncbi:hypothetical protein D3C83_47800 [compost metagenome]
MGDSGEGLIDAEARIQERIEDIAREKVRARSSDGRDPELRHALESLRLAKRELECQLEATSHERRRAQISQAIQEVDRRAAALQ